jgi:cob(I)alamin adenosyltransferase
MSIVTKTGDAGTTGLMYNRRVTKHHPRVEAYGCVDELNSALGLARSLVTESRLQEQLITTQKELVILMGELATATEDLPRYSRDGFPLVTAALTARLDEIAAELEARQPSFHGWATPGQNQQAAALDVARAVCRRAERRVCALHDAGELHNPEIIVYLNRLADVLWLMARWAETHPTAATALPAT